MPTVPALRQLRERRCLSVGDLARRSGIAKSTIVRLEAHGAAAQYRTIRQLAEALEVDPERLVGVPATDRTPRGRTSDEYPGLIEVAEGVWVPDVETPEEIEASFAAMATDEEYAALSRQLDAEFAGASWEALLRGEADLEQRRRS